MPNHIPEAAYEVICVDMFQTLVNVDARLERIWRRILEGDYSEALADRYIASTRDSIVDAFHQDLSRQIEFRSLKEIFLGCFSAFFASEGVGYDPVLASTVYMDEHNNADIYDDSLEFIDRAKRKYRVCLVSDADAEMVASHIEQIPFDDVFISGNIKSYKGNLDGRVFRSVLEHYGVEPLPGRESIPVGSTGTTTESTST